MIHLRLFVLLTFTYCLVCILIELVESAIRTLRGIWNIKVKSSEIDQNYFESKISDEQGCLLGCLRCSIEILKSTKNVILITLLNMF